MTKPDDRITADQRYMKLLKEIMCKEIPGNYAIFLFGSRARKEQKNSPDADVGILGRQPFPMTLKNNIISKIEESIIPFKVDIIDFYQSDSEFKQEALRDIEIWRSQPDIKLD